MKPSRMCETCDHFPETKDIPMCKQGIHMIRRKDLTGDTYYSVPLCKHYEPDKLVIHFEKFPMR